MKTLCLGNNDVSTDQLVSCLALENNLINHGFVNDADFIPEISGYYHTTVVDIPWGKLIDFAKKFDAILMLDQPQSDWTHWKCLQATYKLMVELENVGQRTIFRDNKNIQKFVYWSNLLAENKSFCAYPWVNLFNTGDNLKLCARSDPTITTLSTLQSWDKDSKFQEIRKKMVDGEMLPEHCNVCYNYEKLGIESYRQFDSFDWVSQLDISSIEELSTITRPYYYELNTGNNCNIKCRGCDPAHSELIGVEAKKFNIIPPMPFVWKVSSPTTDCIDIDLLDSKSTVYFQGGEPTIMPEVLNFLNQCIKKNKTDFNLSMCTNGVKLPEKFLEVLKYFSNVNFSFSIDGFGKVNDYWRSGSQWDKVIENARRLESLGYNININTVPGIYNVTNLHLLFEFLEKNFPFTTVYLQLNYNKWQSAYNHPDTQKVIESLEKCMNTSIYWSNGKSCKSGIDGLYSYYTNHPLFNKDDLRSFFKYNDQLDKARGVKLEDYIPELESCRKYIL